LSSDRFESLRAEAGMEMYRLQKKNVRGQVRGVLAPKAHPPMTMEGLRIARYLSHIGSPWVTLLSITGHVISIQTDCDPRTENKDWARKYTSFTSNRTLENSLTIPTTSSSKNQITSAKQFQQRICTGGAPEIN